MKVVERFDSDEKKFYPYNSDDIEEDTQEINKFVEVPNPNPNKTDSASKKPINFSQSDQFKSIDPTLQPRNNNKNNNQDS